jgi:hypothetical protein
MSAVPLDGPSRPRLPLRFWLRAAGLGLIAAFACAMLAAGLFSMAAGVDHVADRGWSVLTGAMIAKGMTLTFIYMAFLSLFLIPFAVAVTPVCYWLARKLGDGGAGRMLFALFAMVFCTAGPVLLERGLIALQRWRGLSSGVRELQLAEYFTAYGLLAAPLTAFILWPLLRRMEAGLTAQPITDGKPQ